MSAGPIRPYEPPSPIPVRDQATGVHSQTAVTPEAEQTVPPVMGREEIKTHWDVDNGVVVEITDRQSGELVRQIPSQQVLNVAHYIEQYLLQSRSSSDERERLRADHE